MTSEIAFTGRSGVKWRYWTDQPLGKPGFFGVVYAAEGSDGRPMAVKVIQKQRFGAFGDRLLLREIDIGRRVVKSGSDMLLPAIDAVDMGDAFLLVMARAYGMLADVPMPSVEADVISILADIATGLQQAHTIDIIHRDLKPSNVLRHGGRWKPADFGIARDQEIGTQDPTFIGWGSWPYMAPELWDLKSPTVKTDLYALGCVGYELLTGSPPFTGDQAAIREGHRSRVLPEVPASNITLKNLIARLLAKEPGDRPQDARAVLERLQRAMVPPTPSMQTIAAGLGAHAKDRDRAIAEATAAKDTAEIRRQHTRQAKGDLQEILRDTREELLAAEPETTLERIDPLPTEFLSGSQVTSRFSLLTVNATLRVYLWKEPVHPPIPEDTLIIAGYVMIANRRDNPAFDQTSWMRNKDILPGDDNSSRGNMKYLPIIFPTQLNAANVAYEVRNGRLGWQIYKFRCLNEAGIAGRASYFKYGPSGRTIGLYHDHFFDRNERTLMLHPARHSWTMTRVSLSRDRLLELFQEAVELRPDDSM